MPEVKCADCGYLSLRHTNSRQLLDAEEQFRTTGNIPSPKKGGIDLSYDDYPICFMRVVNFRTDQEAGKSKDQDKCVRCLKRERECDKFTPWLMGFTPKEHYEVIQENTRLKWQADREREDREFRAEQVRLADERYRKSLRDNWWRLVATAFGSLLVGLAVAYFGVVIGRNANRNTATSLPQTNQQTSKADSSHQPSSPE